MTVIFYAGFISNDFCRLVVIRFEALIFATAAVNVIFWKAVAEEGKSIRV